MQSAQNRYKSYKSSHRCSGAPQPTESSPPDAPAEVPLTQPIATIKVPQLDAEALQSAMDEHEEELSGYGATEEALDLALEEPRAARVPVC